MGLLRKGTTRVALLAPLLCAGWASCSTSRVPSDVELSNGLDAALPDAGVGSAHPGRGLDGGEVEAGQDSGSVVDAATTGRDGASPTDGGETPACRLDGGCQDAAPPTGCPGDFTAQRGACPAGWTCFSPEANPALLCGIETFAAVDCEAAGGVVIPNPGGGVGPCLPGGFIGGLPHGIEGASCCARPHIDCGVCEPAAVGGFGCDGVGQEMWECFGGAAPEALLHVCSDLGTAIARYCCQTASAPVCKPGT